MASTATRGASPSAAPSPGTRPSSSSTRSTRATARTTSSSVPELGVNETVRGHNDFLYLSGKVDQRWNERWTSSVRLNVGDVTIERQGGGLDGGVTFPSAGNFQDRNSVLAAGKTCYAGGSVVSETTLQYSRFRWNYGRAANEGSPQTVALDPSGQTIAVLGNPGLRLRRHREHDPGPGEADVSPRAAHVQGRRRPHLGRLRPRRRRQRRRKLHGAAHPGPGRRRSARRGRERA